MTNHKVKCANFEISNDKPFTLIAGPCQLENHPWFVGVQFHPEFKSRPLAPHPLFSSFIKAAKNNSNKKNDKS